MQLRSTSTGNSAVPARKGRCISHESRATGTQCERDSTSALHAARQRGSKSKRQDADKCAGLVARFTGARFTGGASRQAGTHARHMTLYTCCPTTHTQPCSLPRTPNCATQLGKATAQTQCTVLSAAVSTSEQQSLQRQPATGGQVQQSGLKQVHVISTTPTLCTAANK